MRVLHIWNTAGMASTLAKWQRKLYRWETQVITRRAFDPLGLTTYGKALNVATKQYISIAMILRLCVWGHPRVFPRRYCPDHQEAVPVEEGSSSLPRLEHKG